jgi:hypothetical protein
MTDALGSVSTQQSFSKGTSAASTQNSAATYVQATQAASSSANSTAPISPRIVVDPLAGVITQFLTSTGGIEAQIPSQAVVAYLRAGLEADGTSRPSDVPQKKPTSDTTGLPTQASSVIA